MDFGMGERGWVGGGGAGGEEGLRLVWRAGGSNLKHTHTSPLPGLVFCALQLPQTQGYYKIEAHEYQVFWMLLCPPHSLTLPVVDFRRKTHWEFTIHTFFYTCRRRNKEKKNPPPPCTHKIHTYRRRKNRHSPPPTQKEPHLPLVREVQWERTALTPSSG